MPPEIKSYTFGHSFTVTDINHNGRIDDGEITSVADGRVSNRQDAEAAMKRWGVNVRPAFVSPRWIPAQAGRWLEDRVTQGKFDGLIKSLSDALMKDNIDLQSCMPVMNLVGADTLYCSSH